MYIGLLIFFFFSYKACIPLNEGMMILVYPYFQITDQQGDGVVFAAAGCKHVTLPTASTAFWREYSCAPNDLQRAVQHNPPVCPQGARAQLQRSPPALSYNRQTLSLLALIAAAPCRLRPTTCNDLSGILRLSAQSALQVRTSRFAIAPCS